MLVTFIHHIVACLDPPPTPIQTTPISCLLLRVYLYSWGGAGGGFFPSKKFLYGQLAKWIIPKLTKELGLKYSLYFSYFDIWYLIFDLIFKIWLIHLQEFVSKTQTPLHFPNCEFFWYLLNFLPRIQSFSSL